MSSSAQSALPNTTIFSGLADVYNAYRPLPPQVLVDVLTRRAGVQRPRLVVDVGCGTGHSTFLWTERAERVIGIEPNEDMRRVALARRDIVPRTDHITFTDATSTATGLDDGAADIVTFSQALHHMEPAGTLDEVQRILRPGGIVAAYDYRMPPMMSWEAESALMDFLRKVRPLQDQLRDERQWHWWSKDTHAERFQDSGHFRQVSEFFLHNEEMGNAERLVGLLHSLGSLRELLDSGYSKAELGLDEFRDRAHEILGNEMQPWIFSYQVIVGLK